MVGYCISLSYGEPRKTYYAGVSCACEPRFALAKLRFSAQYSLRSLRFFEAPFSFLGFEIRMSKGLATGKHYPHVCPAPKAIAKIKARMKELTVRNRTPIPLTKIIDDMNASLRGWVNYFHFRNSSKAMKTVGEYADLHLRLQLRKRHKIKNWKTGSVRFPRQKIHGHYGLYKTPTKAAWKPAHA